METTIFRSDQRFSTKLDWLDAKHCFSFGPHYDPDNMGFGLLVVFNEDVIAPGKGFGTHSHADMEIVTWVLSGKLEHKDSNGNHGVIEPGKVQRMSAGSGISHSEFNASADEPCHLTQMWVLPETKGLAPSYEEVDVSTRLAEGGLVKIVSSSKEDNCISMNQSAAEMFVATLADGEEVSMPHGSAVHLFVAAGSCQVAGEELVHGDSFRAVDVGPNTGIQATNPDTHLVFWAFS